MADFDRKSWTRERIMHWLATLGIPTSVSIVLDAPNEGEHALWISETPKYLDTGVVADAALAFMAERVTRERSPVLSPTSIFSLIVRFDMRGDYHESMRVRFDREPSDEAAPGSEPRFATRTEEPYPLATERARLARLLNALADVNVTYLTQHPDTPKLAESGALYDESTSDGEWRDIGSILRHRAGRAVDLAAWRAAEHRAAGVDARVGVQAVGAAGLLVVVMLPNCTIEHPWEGLDVMDRNRPCKCGGPVPRRQGKCDACRERAKGG